MSIFKKHKSSADRSATDRRRHKEKIEKAIREGIHDIIADESIIGQDGKKKLRIPVRGIKEYKFVHSQGPQNKNVGSAPGKQIQKGQKVGQGRKVKKKGKGKKPGNDKGEEFYEIEMTLEEVAKYLFEDLKLPDLEKKQFANITSQKIKRKGYRKEGIRPRLSKKETIKNKIKRKKKAIKSGTFDPDGEERFTFHKADLKYKHIEVTTKKQTNAVIFFTMDVSGSMTKNKKFIARSFFFLLYQFIRHRYDAVDVVFVSHTTEAYEVSEKDFFTRGSSGGTYISSGLEKCHSIIKERYPKQSWNIYNFYCSDGDNWTSDNEKALKYMKILKELSQLAAYIQINPSADTSLWGTEGAKIFADLDDETFKVLHVNSKDQIWPGFKSLFGGKLNE